MNAATSTEHLRQCKKVGNAFNVFLEPMEKIWAGVPPMPCYSTQSEGALAQYTFAEKEYKLKLNHGYTTFPSSPFNSSQVS